MNTPANKKSNAERSGEYKLKKHLKDTNFKEKERIRIKEYREKKKKYQSEAEKLSQHEKRKLRKQKYKLAKKLEKNNLTALDLIKLHKLWERLFQEYLRSYPVLQEKKLL